MKLAKLFAVAALLSFALAAYATTTWTTPTASSKYTATQATTTTGTEAAPTLATQGFSLEEGVSVYRVVLDSMQTLDGGVYVLSAEDAGIFTGFCGDLRAYLYSPVNGTWSRADALDLEVTPNNTSQTWTVTVGLKVGRIAYLPYGNCPGGRVTVEALRGQ